VGAVLALGSAGAVALGAGSASAASAPSATSAASAAAVHPNYYSCSNGGIPGVCASILRPTALLAPNDWPFLELFAGNLVNIECWYPTTEVHDGYYDHVSWTNGDNLGITSGHVDDDAVDLGGKTPNELDLPQCAS
jgi:hypothetical protein